MPVLIIGWSIYDKLPEEEQKEFALVERYRTDYFYEFYTALLMQTLFALPLGVCRKCSNQLSRLACVYILNFLFHS